VPLLDLLQQSVEDAGSFGPILFIFATGLWAFLLLPGPLIMALAGTLFSKNPILAIQVISLGFALAQAAAFLLSRAVLRERVLARVGNTGWFLWLEDKVRLKGALGVLVIRTLPFFPNSLANYAFGLTNIRFGPYLVASWLGTLPMIFCYIFGAAGFVHLLRGV
jgi:uncharacterized membrane protein YdjX (TVP38/TMEM64 family)